jgi:hypothetical protein
LLSGSATTGVGGPKKTISKSIAIKQPASKKPKHH